MQSRLFCILVKSNFVNNIVKSPTSASVRIEKPTQSELRLGISVWRCDLFFRSKIVGTHVSF